MRTLVLLVALCGLAAHAEEIVLEDKGQRLRAGASLGLGTVVGWPSFTMRAEGRVGFQLSPRLSLFGLLAGGGDLGSASGGQLDFGAVAELIPVEWFYCGAGLVVSYGTTYLTNSTAIFMDAYGSLRPALDLRFGFNTGRSLPPFFNRFGFNIGIHTLVMLHGLMTVQGFAFGGSFGPSRAMVTVTPVLTFGFDFR